MMEDGNRALQRHVMGVELTHVAVLNRTVKKVIKKGPISKRKMLSFGTIENVGYSGIYRLQDDFVEIFMNFKTKQSQPIIHEMWHHLLSFLKPSLPTS